MPQKSAPLPDFVTWSLFPFEGDLRVKPVPDMEAEEPRSGDPGGRPCPSCGVPDDDYVWVDDHWRLRSFPDPPGGIPVLVMLESRGHLDIDNLDDERAAEFGVMIVRLNRVIMGLGGIARVHSCRWGDGSSHLHVWFYGRPVGALHLRGYGLPMWERILPPVPREVWLHNLARIASSLAEYGGRAVITA